MRRTFLNLRITLCFASTISARETLHSHPNSKNAARCSQCQPARHKSHSSQQRIHPEPGKDLWCSISRIPWELQNPERLKNTSSLHCSLSSWVHISVLSHVFPCFPMFLGTVTVHDRPGCLRLANQVNISDVFMVVRRVS